MLQIEENKKKLNELGINTEKDTKGTKITPPDDDEEVDREYVSGHESFSNAEEEDERVGTKKAKNKKVTILVKRPNTRSRATAPLSIEVPNL